MDDYPEWGKEVGAPIEDDHDKYQYFDSIDDVDIFMLPDKRYDDDGTSYRFVKDGKDIDFVSMLPYSDNEDIWLVYNILL